MVKVTNKSQVTLGLPNNVGLPVGESKTVDDSVLHNRIVAAWVDRSMLKVHGAKSASTPHSTVEDSTGESETTKDELIAELAKYGYKRDRRTSQDNLQQLLDEVRSERGE